MIMNIADQIKIQQDNSGMLRRALERIIQLYTDKAHFIYELLQNAEDAEAKSIKFVQYKDRLEVYHDGKPFTEENLQRLCDIGQSDKAGNLNQIGEFGVGFKSVFGICDTVKLYSMPQNYKGQLPNNANPFAVQIYDFVHPEDIPQTEIESDFTTKFVFPYSCGKSFSGYRSIDILNNGLKQRLQNLGITTLLFMNNLSLIEYKINIEGSRIEGKYQLDKKLLNDHCSLVSALGESTLKNEEKISYLKFSRRIDYNSHRTVDIAFPVKVSDDGKYECQKLKSPYISVYFPTETESKLDFIVQGPYRTTPNRSSIPCDDLDNIQLAKETGILLSESIRELRNTKNLNMSFIRALPTNAARFEHFGLFGTLFETTRKQLSNEKILPCKRGGYTSALTAKIARNEKLAELITDGLLSELIHDYCEYHWLPTFLTESNQEYRYLYDFFSNEMKIEVIRPESLRGYFDKNPDFLPARSNSWLIELYRILETVPYAFSKSGQNLLTSNIVKTSAGAFMAPYRKIGSQFLPNVFLPSKNITSKDINIVDSEIYEKCKDFFDNILQLEKPNEYEFFINDFKKRSEESIDTSKHIEDVKILLKYKANPAYTEEIVEMMKNYLVLRCKNKNENKFINPYKNRIYLPCSETGIDIEAYFRNIADRYIIDADFYENNGVSIQNLLEFNLFDTLVTGIEKTTGIYYSSNRHPDWSTNGDFRYRFSMECISEALKYISLHPGNKDSILKSKAIFQTLLENEAQLTGKLIIKGNTPDINHAYCDLISLLRREKCHSEWNGNWLYTESNELVSQNQITKHDLNHSIYGNVSPDSSIYEMLGFKKSSDDLLAELNKDYDNIPVSKREAYFAIELARRYGITPDDLKTKFSGGSGKENSHPEEYPFPIGRVKNWQALKKHAAEMLIYANPVEYDFKVRHIRVSNCAAEIRAYLMNIYRYDGIYKYACQMCHKPNIFEYAQIFNDPKVELDPMNLCLCPNCASEYKILRNNSVIMDNLKNDLLSYNEKTVHDDSHIAFFVGNKELWFAQTHFAEIHELLKLQKDISEGRHAQTDSVSNTGARNEDEFKSKDGLNVYKAYIGKRVFHRISKFSGKVTACDGKYIFVLAEDGDKQGEIIKYALSNCIKDNLLKIIDQKVG